MKHCLDESRMILELSGALINDIAWQEYNAVVNISALTETLYGESIIRTKRAIETNIKSNPYTKLPASLCKSKDGISVDIKQLVQILCIF